MKIRSLFKITCLGALLAPLAYSASLSADSSPGTPIESLPKYVDQLVIPKRLRVVGTGPHDIEIPLTQFQARLHRDLPETTEWGYGGSSPGPTIEVESGSALRVHWKNQLPPAHIFKLPKGVDTLGPDVRAVTHLHGADVTEAHPMDRLHNNDGWPDAWNTPGQQQIADYPNALSARMLWYHDHAMSSTGRNVAAGLVGIYEIHDALEKKLNLPAGRFEIPLLLQARGVQPDGKLYYTDDIGQEFYGNVVAVNGKLWPYQDVEPRKYRLRIVNASNARTYILKLVDQGDKSAGPAFAQIGSDGGFLESPVILNQPGATRPNRLNLAPAERMDFIVDFSKYAGRNLVLQNSARDPNKGESEIPELMLFRVGNVLSEPDTSELPAKLREIRRLDPAAAAQTRRIVFDQMKMNDGTFMLMLNGKGWMDPLTERPVLGTTEVWELTNTLSDTHPFHLHGAEFQVLDRRLFDVVEYLKSGKIVFLASAIAPQANEMGWKDTVQVFPQMITRIIPKFGPHRGHFVYHCHILEHEDMDMMRPYDIVSP